MLQFFNMLAANKNNNINNTTNNLQNQQPINTTTSNVNTESVTSENDTSEIYVENAKIIEQFIKCCNEANISTAYDMLSEDCKRSMYPNLDSFTQNYYKNIFKSNMIYNIQRWSGLIYKVDLKENALHTGKLTNEAKQDFITVVSEDGVYKLNINNYIGKTVLNKKESISKIDFCVKTKDTYINDETYTFEIKNNNEKDIYLDNLESTSTVYLVDENGVKHVAYLHKMAKEDLHLYPYSSKTIKITFSNRYISGRTISRIVFENVILDDTKNETQNISINL